MNRTVIVWVVCVLAMIVLLGTGLLNLAPGIGVKNSVAESDAGASGEALIKADFTLQTAGNKTVRAKDLRGKYLLIYFGYTHCPDVCPTTLLLMSNVLSHAGAAAGKIQPVFISVDPARDTPEVAAAYAKNFGKNFLGLSGTPAQIAQAAESFKVYYSKVDDKNSALGYGVDHSSFIYLMGPDGHYIDHFPSSDAEQEITEGVRRDVH